MHNARAFKTIANLSYFQNRSYASYIAKYNSESKRAQAKESIATIKHSLEFLKHPLVGERKARVVAKGYTRREGIDFTEVFSLVTRRETIHLFLIVGTQQGWPIYHLDIKS